MHINKYLRKKSIIFIISIIFILGCVAIVYYINNYNNVNELIETNVRNLEVIYDTDNKSLNYISTPLDYSSGITMSPSNLIRIVNTSENKTTYKVYLYSTTDNLTGLSDSKIYVSINENDGVLLSSLIDDGLLYTSTIGGNEEQIINIKIWLSSEYITENDLSKSLNLKLKIEEV